ncbi:MAG: hypothetical protein IJ830_00430 [Alphaproteobacteria bacterium]|nr:hypothetical protein [Alphaproteobacteria bacterium]
MKNVFYTLFFLSFAFFYHPADAADYKARCKPFVEAPNVEVIAAYETLKYDRSKVSATLARLHQKEYGGYVDEGYRVNGLSTYDLSTQLDFRVAKTSFRDGVTCFYPTDIILTLKMKNPTIYIARGIKPGTCEYEVALRHEQTHQQINIEVLEHYMPKIKDVFIKTVKKYAVAGRQKDDISLDAAQQSLQKKYIDAINPVLDEIKSEIKQEQAKLDNLENYAYEQSLCQ